MAIDFSAPLVEPQNDPEWSVNPVVMDTPPAVTAFDLDTVKVALAPYKAQIDDMVVKAKSIQISDEASQVLAVELGTTARKLKNQVETLRKSTVQPLNDHVKDVNNLAKSFTEPLDAAERDLR